MVKLLDCGRTEFAERNKEKKVYCFGAGRQLAKFLKAKHEIKMEAVIDNHKEGTQIVTDGVSLSLLSFEEFVRQVTETGVKDVAVVITCLAFEEILQQLDEVSVLDGMECYIHLFLEEFTETSEHIGSCEKVGRIPKKIHYCWFGKGEMPEAYQKNLESWKKYCPDYEMIRWDETNYDVTKSTYMRQAYEKKKWAFVSDYARIDIVYQEGGIYLDTDVELLKSYDDFLGWKLFCGYQSGDEVAFGLGFGAVKGHVILKELLEWYDRMTFIKENGEINDTACPVYQSAVLERFGFELNRQFQERDGVALYPKDFFSPMSYTKGMGNLTANSHSIHWYSASWHGTEKEKKRNEFEQSVMRVKQRMMAGQR